MDKDTDILNEAAKGLTITNRPYLKIAEKLGVSETEVINTLNDLKLQGKILKIRALLNYEKLGYTVNALIAVNTNDPERVYKFVSSHVNVSHSYERSSDPAKFPYNLFLMCHFKDDENLNNLKELLKSNNEKFVVLKTLKRFKHSNTKL